MFDDFDERPVTLEKIAELMREGSIWIERQGGDGFYYITGTFKEAKYANNQELLKQAIKLPGVRCEQWREGWGNELRTTGLVRYII